MNCSDTYTGQRWTYGSELRPFLSLFGYFDGWILFSDEQHPDFPTFGTMQTSKPIPPATAKRWDLILIKEKQMAIKFDIHVMERTPSAAHLAQACAALWNDIQADPENWTDTDEILNAYLVPLCDLGTRTYGATELGWALMDAGLDKDDAETCVDLTIPNKPDVYADNAHVWEMAFDRS